MAENVSTSYKRLLEIQLLHHYWLDDGATVFDLLPMDKKEERLLSYDRRPFLGLAPTAATGKALQGMGGIYRNTAWGCLVGVPEHAEISGTARFQFVVTLRNPAMVSYTALTLLPQQIYELFHINEKKLYRYKTNVPVLSNLTGTAREIGGAKALCLSREYPDLDPEDRVESLFREDGALMQLISDPPDATRRQLAAQAANLPVFVHQGDMPVITPPEGLEGTPPRGILLSEDVPDNCFLLLRFTPVRDDDQDFSLVDSNGHPKTGSPIFQVHFKNRSSIWSYFNKKTGVEISSEPEPLPLTHFGNAGTKQKPSAALVQVKRSDSDPKKITRLVSKVFV
jgi:hypothetical protein